MNTEQTTTTASARPERTQAQNKAQAQHSPDKRVPTPCELVPHRTQEEYDTLQSHADKLAEALRQCLHMLPLNTSNSVLRQIKTEAWQKITAYESEAQS